MRKKPARGLKEGYMTKVSCGFEQEQWDFLSRLAIKNNRSIANIIRHCVAYSKYSAFGVK